MRIISGQYRGRKLKAPRGCDVRPTSDRLRETLFNIIGPRITNLVLADIFAGTGAIGIEAISRGAREVLFIEKSLEGGRLIRQNLELCGIAKGFRLMQEDVFPALRLLGREGFTADYFFLDPPYDWKPYRDLLGLLFDLNLACPNSQVIIEHHSKSLLPDGGDGYIRKRVVRQSDHCLSFYGRSEVSADIP